LGRASSNFRRAPSSRPDCRSKLVQVAVAQGKPVARRGRKARDLSETARLPTQKIRPVPCRRS
jgi:hypothetical protein